MQLVKAVGHVRVVLEHAGVLRFARAPAAEQASLRVRERAEKERRERTGGFEVVGSFESASGLGQGCQRKPVPRRDRLVVTERLRPQLALFEESCASVTIEVAANDEAPVLERLQELVWNVVVLRPRVRQAFYTVGVCILRRGEAALGQP